MFNGSLAHTQTPTRPAFGRSTAAPAMSKMTASYIGAARESRGEAGSLYRANNGKTYFVPSIGYGNHSLPIIAETEEVISNPSGFYGDMLFISVPPTLMARGLRAALEAAILVQQENDLDAAQCC